MKDYSQKSTLYITASPIESTVGWQEGSTAYFNIYTNLTDWEATTNAWWITLTKDIPNNTLKATVFMNYISQPRSDTIRITGQGATTPQAVVLIQDGITSIAEITPDIDLKVYPNPFVYSTNIEYELKNEADVTIEVYNMVGKMISSVVNGHQAPGMYNYSFNDASNNGVYILRTVVNNKIFIKKLIKTN